MLASMSSKLKGHTKVIVWACLGLLVFTLTALADGSGRKGGAPLNPFRSFPLWKDVPGQTFAILGEGELRNHTRWGAYGSKGGRRAVDSQFPCVTVASITRQGIYGDAHECGRPTPAVGGPPVLVVIGESVGPITGESALGASFAPDVMKAEFKLASGERIVRRTKPLNERQQTKTGLLPFRYVALATLRTMCVASIVGYDASGRTLFDLPTEEGC
jgi:hypothetical protein